MLKTLAPERAGGELGVERQRQDRPAQRRSVLPCLVAKTDHADRLLRRERCSTLSLAVIEVELCRRPLSPSPVYAYSDCVALTRCGRRALSIDRPSIFVLQKTQKPILGTESRRKRCWSVWSSKGA